MDENKDNRELKTRSFRIDDQTADKIKEIAQEIGGNQQTTLAKLIEAYEFQSGKVKLGDKKDEIEKFESYISVLTRMYMDSLENCNNIEELVKTQFSSQLNSKDLIISDLQEKNKKNAEIISSMKMTEKDLENETRNLKETLRKETGRSCALEENLRDKDKLNHILTMEHEQLSEKVEEMKNDISELESLRQEKDSAVREVSELRKLLDEKERYIREQDEKHAAMLKSSTEEAERVLKNETDRIISECEKKTNKAISEYEKKILKMREDFFEEKQAYIQKKNLESERINEKLIGLIEKIKDRNNA